MPLSNCALIDQLMNGSLDEAALLVMRAMLWIYVQGRSPKLAALVRDMRQMVVAVHAATCDSLLATPYWPLHSPNTHAELYAYCHSSKACPLRQSAAENSALAEASCCTHGTTRPPAAASGSGAISGQPTPKFNTCPHTYYPETACSLYTSHAMQNWAKSLIAASLRCHPVPLQQYHTRNYILYPCADRVTFINSCR